jgi:hypothetical protein
LLRYTSIKRFDGMAKIYSKKALASKDLKPKKEVISFLISY